MMRTRERAVDRGSTIRLLLFCSLLFSLLSNDAQAESASARNNMLSSPLEVSSVGGGVDREAYADLIKNRVRDGEELYEWFRDEQVKWMELAPPEAGVKWGQEAEQVVPVVNAKWLGEVLGKLPPVYLYSVPAYRLRIWEDEGTRGMVVGDEKGQVIWRHEAESDYDPAWYVKERWPWLFGKGPWSERLEWLLRQYDPARLELKVTVIPADRAEMYLYVKGRVGEEEAKLAASGTGEVGLLRYDGPPVTELVLCGIARTSGGVRLTVAYPWEAGNPTNSFTNRVEVFCTDELTEGWWESLGLTNASGQTNWVAWLDATVTGTWARIRSYAIGNGDWDTDGDGVPDARERLVYQSNPNDAQSRPVRVSGVISYGGPEVGPIRVLAVTNASDWSLGRAVMLAGPGGYTNDRVVRPGAYWIRAYRDVEEDRLLADWEPRGEYGGSPVYVTSDVAGVDIAITDVPSVWGQVGYTGAPNGDVWVVAVTESNSLATTFAARVSWIRNGQPIEFPAAYRLVGMPAGSYWIRAFMDTDGDGNYTVGEAAGACGVGAVVVTQRTMGVNVEMAKDRDGDGLPDGWELMMFGHLGETGEGDADGDGLSHAQELSLGTHPGSADTDDDGFSDYEETQLTGTSPTNGQDGRAMLESARAKIAAHWKLIYPSPLVFTNIPGSAGDLQDMANALGQLSGIFYEVVTGEEGVVEISGVTVLENRPTASNFESVVEAGVWCKKALAERERAVSWCEPGLTNYLFSRCGGYADLLAVRGWVISNVHHFADSRVDINAHFAGGASDFARLSTTDLVVMAGLPADFFSEDVSSNGWAGVPDEEYGWAALRKTVRPLKWVIPEAVGGALGYREYEKEPEITVYFDKDEASGRAWTEELCETVVHHLSTEILSKPMQSLVRICEWPEGFALQWGTYAMRGYWSGPPWDVRGNCASPAPIADVAVEDRGSEHVREEGAYAVVWVHPTRTNYVVEVYGLLPRCDLSPEECYTGVTAFLSGRPRYKKHETLSGGTGYIPPGLSGTTYCTWGCLQNPLTQAIEVWTHTPFYPFQGFWENVEYDYPNTNCAACISDPSCELRPYYADEIHGAQITNYNCTWWYDGCEAASVYSLGMGATVSTIPWYDGQSDARPLFLAVIKYQWKYE